MPKEIVRVLAGLALAALAARPAVASTETKPAPSHAASTAAAPALVEDPLSVKEPSWSRWMPAPTRT